MTAMYQSYFGLTEAPFSIAPNPRYLFMSQRHQEALAHLLYGINGDGGFVLLTGEVGTGKTTVCRCLLEQIPPTCDVAYIFNPRLTVEELLSTICVEFGISCPSDNTSIKLFVDRINAYLLEAHARGRHSVLIIDEAQNLSTAVLEQMRLLTNLETDQRKLLQIILLGQPELLTKLDRPRLRQLSQRIVARYHLGPLSKSEVATYVRHRLEVSGAQRALIPARLMTYLFRLSGGVPRVINVLCDRALLGAYVQGKEKVDRATLAQAAREVLSQAKPQRRGRLIAALASLFLLILGATALAYYLQLPHTPPAPATRITPPATGPAQTMPRQGVAEQAKAAQSEAAPISLEWSADLPLSRSKPMAYAALFQAWGGQYREGEACQEAAELGLRCRIARAGLEELRQLNRPAVLSVRDHLGNEFYATLIALSDQTATFIIGSETRTIALDELAERWSGHYTMLWRIPPAEIKNLRLGDSGAGARWLDQQLALAQGKTSENRDNAVFDTEMKRRLKAFQLAQGLVPDGTIGQQTLIRLSSVADQDAPRLLAGQEGK